MDQNIFVKKIILIFYIVHIFFYFNTLDSYVNMYYILNQEILTKNICHNIFSTTFHKGKKIMIYFNALKIIYNQNICIACHLVNRQFLIILELYKINYLKNLKFN